MTSRPPVPPGALQVHRIALADRHDVLAFRSGDDDLDSFLRDDALRLEAGGVTRTYLARHRGTLVGYITILTDAIVLETRERRSLALAHGDHPVVPAVKVARLAVATEYRSQHRGAGEWLMRFAFEVAVDVSVRVGCRVLSVDAYPDSMGFYEKLGFVRNRSATYRDRPRPSMRFDLRATPAPRWISRSPA